MPERSNKKCGHDGCGKRLHRRNRSGFCRVHYLLSVREVPHGRMIDYTWLRGRGMTKEQAIAHLNADLPCIRTSRVPTYGYKKVSVSAAVNLASDAMNVCARDVLSDCRSQFAVDCRAVVVRILSQQGMAYAEIGRRIKRDHTTIRYLNHTFPRRAAKNPALAKVVADILARAA